jgi:hypothetical protein
MRWGGGRSGIGGGDQFEQGFSGRRLICTTQADVRSSAVVRHNTQEGIIKHVVSNVHDGMEKGENC